MTANFTASRRAFLKTAAALSVVGRSGAPFALNLAAIGAVAAQTAQADYKAIVCLFLSGGNDHANTVVATDPGSWADYVRIRSTSGPDSIALRAVGMPGGVLPIVPVSVQPGRSFGLHPALQPLKRLFDDGRGAVVANVGPLVMPTTLAQFRSGSVQLPPMLFSHNDQQSLWQTFKPEGPHAGWGGRMGDLFVAANTTPIFTAISVSGNASFLVGQKTNQYQISRSGAIPISGLSGTLFGASPQSNPLQAIISGESRHLIEKAHAGVVQRAIAAQSSLAAGMLEAGANGVPDPTFYVDPNTGLAAENPVAVQLQTVARIIGGRRNLGAKRQIFFVNVDGFDSHDNQVRSQADLLAQIAHAISYFDGVASNLQGSDLRQSVTLFTASDFGRTFTSNGDGTDHGWGSHHFVVGGAVRGGDIYGSFPVTGLNHSQDVGSGSLLPQFSVEQYGATLASWFGLTSTEIADVFPAIANFSVRNIRFMA